VYPWQPPSPGSDIVILGEFDAASWNPMARTIRLMKTPKTKEE